MIQHKNQTGDLLLSITKSVERLLNKLKPRLKKRLNLK